MGIRYAKLFEAAKSMFKSWDSRAVWTWLLLEKRCGRDWSFRWCFSVYMTLWQRNDIWKFDADANLFWEIKCKKRDN